MNPLTHLLYQTSPQVPFIAEPLAGKWISKAFSLRLLWLLTSVSTLGMADLVYAQTYPQPAATPYPASPAGEVLQPSDQGESVSALQRQLSALGYYNGPITGYFDLSTQAAVSQFQQANGLTPDGIVGSATTGALDRSSVQPNPASSSGQPATGSIQLNDDGSQVSQLQQQLAQLGYYTGSATGVFDSQTQAAVMSFQRDRGLAVDGIVGSATEAALSQTLVASPQATATTATGTTATPSTTTTPTYMPAATPNDGFLQLGDTGTEVSDLQTRLQALGYYDGPISGSFGSQTQVALIAFQQAQGLTADGIAGPQVDAALGTVSTSVQTAEAQPAPTTSVSFGQPTTTTQTPAFGQSAAATQAPAFGQTTTPTQIPASVPQPTATVQVPPLSSSALPPTSGPSIGQAPSPSSSQQPMPDLKAGRFSVMELQRRLQLRGFDPGEMNGVYDPSTQGAISQAQQAYGLSQSDLFEY